MTTPAHELGLYFTSRDLTADGQPLPDRTVVSASPLQLMTNSISQATGYWDGAIGFFTENAPDVLKGFFFHVRSWTVGTDDNPGTLQLYGSLPVAPPAGTVFLAYVKAVNTFPRRKFPASWYPASNRNLIPLHIRRFRELPLRKRRRDSEKVR